jgi:DNA polymerase III delta subunit
MVITLTGENNFGWQQALAQIIDDFVSEYGNLALERLDGQEASFEQLQAALTSPPFLAARKLVVLRGPSANKQFVEKFEQILAGIPDTTNAVLVELKLDKRLNYYKVLKKETDFREFPVLDVGGLAHWLS